MIARIWKVDKPTWRETGEPPIEALKIFNVMLMNSKFNREGGNLIATGGHSSVVTVWDS